MFDMTMNCDVTIVCREGETYQQAMDRLTGLLQSELCNLADHDVSVRSNVTPSKFHYQGPVGPVTVMALGRKDADALIRDKYDDPGFNPVRDLADATPVWTAWTRQALGDLPGGFGALRLYIPSKNQLLYLGMGSRENLSENDIKEGYLDYINYQTYDMEDGIDLADGGMVMFHALIQDRFHCLGEAIPEILEAVYDDMLVNFIVLTPGLLPGPTFRD